MNKFIFFFLLISINSFSQKSLKKLLKKYNTESVSYVFVDDLNEKIKKTFDPAQGDNKTILLDARELKEYNVSHLKNAIHVGYDNFNLSKTTAKLKDKNATIVVYCSLGIRSEDIAEKLQKAGFKNVYNLFGGIFEWKNSNNKVYTSEEKVTEKVHTFNKDWSVWLKKGIKVYE
ncbi:Rhodanese-like domain-containing protein [Tenacibaculum insulae]